MYLLDIKDWTVWYQRIYQECDPKGGIKEMQVRTLDFVHSEQIRYFNCHYTRIWYAANWIWRGVIGYIVMNQ